MKNYNEMTDEQLIHGLNNLLEAENQDLAMDGSGELGSVIRKGYQKNYDAIYQEIDKREIYVPEDFEEGLPY